MFFFLTATDVTECIAAQRYLVPVEYMRDHQPIYILYDRIYVIQVFVPACANTRSQGQTPLAQRRDEPNGSSPVDSYFIFSSKTTGRSSEINIVFGEKLSVLRVSFVHPDTLHLHSIYNFSVTIFFFIVA